MIKSMTGFGNSMREVDGKKITVEIKSVNHRYAEYNIKVPYSYSFLELAVRNVFSKYTTRGKIDVKVSIDSFGDTSKVVRINHSLAKGYFDALGEIAETYAVANPVTAMNIALFPDVLKSDKAEEDDEAITALVLSVLDEAAGKYNAMRAVEGEKLRNDMLSHLDIIENAVSDIEARMPQIIAEYEVRMRQRIAEILDETPCDESRLLTEVAIFADRIDTNEEQVRLRSHIAQMRSLVGSDEAVGRKFDFVIQEMNREINTIGSKSNDLDVAKIVIEVKAEIEKLREQAQNVE